MNGRSITFSLLVVAALLLFIPLFSVVFAWLATADEVALRWCFRSLAAVAALAALLAGQRLCGRG